MYVLPDIAGIGEKWGGVVNGAPGLELGNHGSFSREAVELLRLELPIQAPCSCDGIFVARGMVGL